MMAGDLRGRADRNRSVIFCSWVALQAPSQPHPDLGCGSQRTSPALGSTDVRLSLGCRRLRPRPCDQAHTAGEGTRTQTQLTVSAPLTVVIFTTVTLSNVQHGLSMLLPSPRPGCRRAEPTQRHSLCLHLNRLFLSKKKAKPSNQVMVFDPIHCALPGRVCACHLCL